MEDAMPNGGGQGWWMYHGDPQHSGYVSASGISSANAGTLQTLFTVPLGGPVLSVPAVTEGYVFVGTANSATSYGANGGSMLKVSLETGQIVARFNWDIPVGERDAHGFTGMGCTPAVTGGQVFFSAFNGKFYCLSSDDLSLQWVTDLRYGDPLHNQPVNNDLGSDEDPVAAGWSSPVVAGGKVYVGMGEGENPALFGFVYCLDAATGDVVWIWCTCQLTPGQDNLPNQIPAAVTRGNVPAMFDVIQPDPGNPPPTGASVWSCIAYDPDTSRLYVSTGNPATNDNGLPAPPAGWVDPHAAPGCTVSLPTAVAPKYTYSVVALDAGTGKLLASFQPTQDTSYRPSDTDIDFGGSPTVFTLNDEKVVAVANKNGSLFILDAGTLALKSWRQLLPYDVSGQRIPSVDPHPTSPALSPPTPDNCESDQNQNENYHGAFGCPAVDPASGTIFVALGGPNYHSPAPGLDNQTTPFMRAVAWDTLDDAWPMQPVSVNLPQGTIQVQQYTNAAAAMYQNPTEVGLSSPAVVNDVVFCSTTFVGLYAFSVADGTLLWSDLLGQQTLGLNGGYGYCMGPAIAGDYVVAGGLVLGGDGGVLKIYALPNPAGGSGSSTTGPTSSGASGQPASGGSVGSGGTTLGSGN
jgi:outer membrane protein assembly factor BamB